MEWEAKLIYIYCTVSQFFSQTLAHIKIRKSPNQKLEFTDAEVISIYIYGLLEGHITLKNIQKFTYIHLKEWFPKLPKYSAFHHRLDELAYEIVSFSAYFIKQFPNSAANKTILIDSMPIMIAKGSRSGVSNIANGLANIGYCASKKIYYWGVKFHLFAQHQKHALPTSEHLEIPQASTHDLNAVKHIFFDFKKSEIIADKAYGSRIIREKVLQQETTLHTPIKLTKKKIS